MISNWHPWRSRYSTSGVKKLSPTGRQLPWTNGYSHLRTLHRVSILPVSAQIMEWLHPTNSLWSSEFCDRKGIFPVGFCSQPETSLIWFCPLSSVGYHRYSCRLIVDTHETPVWYPRILMLNRCVTLIEKSNCSQWIIDAITFIASKIRHKHRFYWTWTVPCQAIQFYNQ